TPVFLLFSLLPSLLSSLLESLSPSLESLSLLFFLFSSRAFLISSRLTPNDLDQFSAIRSNKASDSSLVRSLYGLSRSVIVPLQSTSSKFRGPMSTALDEEDTPDLLELAASTLDDELPPLKF